MSQRTPPRYVISPSRRPREQHPDPDRRAVVPRLDQPQPVSQGAPSSANSSSFLTDPLDLSDQEDSLSSGNSEYRPIVPYVPPPQPQDRFRRHPSQILGRRPRSPQPQAQPQDQDQPPAQDRFRRNPRQVLGPRPRSPQGRDSPQDRFPRSPRQVLAPRLRNPESPPSPAATPIHYSPIRRQDRMLPAPTSSPVDQYPSTPEFTVVHRRAGPRAERAFHRANARAAEAAAGYGGIPISPTPPPFSNSSPNAVGDGGRASPPTPKDGDQSLRRVRQRLRSPDHPVEKFRKFPDTDPAAEDYDNSLTLPPPEDLRDEFFDSMLNPSLRPNHGEPFAPWRHARRRLSKVPPRSQTIDNNNTRGDLSLELPVEYGDGRAFYYLNHHWFEVVRNEQGRFVAPNSFCSVCEGPPLRQYASIDGVPRVGSVWSSILPRTTEGGLEYVECGLDAAVELLPSTGHGIRDYRGVGFAGIKTVEYWAH